MRWLPLATLVLLAGCLQSQPGGPVGDDCPTDPVAVQVPIIVPTMTGGGRLAGGDAVAFPVPLQDAVPADFAWSCVAAVQVVLSWNNTASSGADLYVGVRLPSGLEVIGQDHQQVVLDGAHQEEVLAAVGWGPHDAAQLQQDLTVVVRSDWASLSSSGLPATLDITLLA